jgi:hypothetical protein
MKNKTAAKKVASAKTVQFQVCLTQDGTKLFEKIVEKCRGRAMVFDGAELEEARNMVAIIIIMSGLEITAGLNGVPLPKTWQRQFNQNKNLLLSVLQTKSFNRDHAK